MTKSNIFLLFILVIINNLLHNISEKIIIIIFIVIFFLLTKILNALVTENYNLRIKGILHDINVYVNTLFMLFYNNKNNLYIYRSINFAFQKLNNFLICYSTKLIKKNFQYIINSR